jgi:aryl-alcohol dehydrogenase-like predicted oxidoreductase
MFGGAAYQYANERDAYSFEEQLRAFEELVKQGKIRYG